MLETRCSRSLTLLLLLGGCAPTTAAYLSIPVDMQGEAEVQGEATAAAAPTLVRVPLVELRARMPGFAADRVAFYCRGRTPAPHRLVDDDGDGAPDVAEVVIPIGAAGAALIAVCPGPRATEPWTEHDVRAGATLHFDRARQ